MPRGRTFSGPLLPGTTSVRQVNRRNPRYKRSNAVKRNENTAVKRVYKKAMAPKKPTTVNKTAIATLAKQVRTLQLKHYGDVQYQRQQCKFFTTQGLPTPTYTGGITQMNPLVFPFNCFYDNTPLYLGTVSTTTGDCGYEVMTSTQTQPSGGSQVLWDKDGFGQFNVNAKHDWQRRNNLNTVDPIQYLPLSSALKIHIKMPMFQGSEPVYWNVKLIKTKKMALNNDKMEYGLPAYAGAYFGLALDDLVQRRSLSKKYHTVLQDKWIKMVPPASSKSVGNTQSKPNIVERSINLYHSFKGKPVRPQLQTTQQAQLGADFWQYVAEDEVIWCLISNSIKGWVNPPDSQSSGSAGNTPITVSMRRVNKWRDETGTWGG